MDNIEDIKNIIGDRKTININNSSPKPKKSNLKASNVRTIPLSSGILYAPLIIIINKLNNKIYDR